MKFAIPFRVPSFDQLKPRERLLAAGSGLVLLIVIMDRLVLSPGPAGEQAGGQHEQREVTESPSAHP